MGRKQTAHMVFTTIGTHIIVPMRQSSAFWCIFFVTVYVYVCTHVCVCIVLVFAPHIIPVGGGTIRVLFSFIAFEGNYYYYVFYLCF